MNRRLTSEFPGLLRTLCAQSSKQSAFRPDYMTPRQLVDDPAIQALLQKSKLTSCTPITDPKIKLSILTYFSRKCKVPVASDAFLKMSTADGMAAWYSSQLKPCRARPHARNLIRHTLGDGGESKELDDRIDLERDAVQRELETRIPSNVALDERTFLKVDETWVRKRQLPKPQYENS